METGSQTKWSPVPLVTGNVILTSTNHNAHYATTFEQHGGLVCMWTVQMILQVVSDWTHTD